MTNAVTLRVDTVVVEQFLMTSWEVLGNGYRMLLVRDHTHSCHVSSLHGAGTVCPSMTRSRPKEFFVFFSTKRELSSELAMGGKKMLSDLSASRNHWNHAFDDRRDSPRRPLKSRTPTA